MWTTEGVKKILQRNFSPLTPFLGGTFEESRSRVDSSVERGEIQPDNLVKGEMKMHQWEGFI